MKYKNCPYYESQCNTLDCYCLKYQAFNEAQDPLIIKQELQELGIDNNLSDWDKIMAMQKKFASRFSNTDNPSKKITDQWNKEYLICIEDEIAELFDYIDLPSKLHSLNEFKELKKEVIDVLHFVMDTFITGGITSQEIQKRYLDRYNIINIDNFFKFAFKKSQNILINQFQLIKGKSDKTNAFEALQEIWHIDSEKINNILLDLSINLLLMNRKVRSCISWKHWKKPNKSINYDRLYDIYVELFDKFLLLAAFVFDNSDEIIQTYIKKNIENIRRQKLGY